MLSEEIGVKIFEAILNSSVIVKNDLIIIYCKQISDLLNESYLNEKVKRKKYLTLRISAVQNIIDETKNKMIALENLNLDDSQIRLEDHYKFIRTYYLLIEEMITRFENGENPEEELLQENYKLIEKIDGLLKSQENFKKIFELMKETVWGIIENIKSHLVMEDNGESLQRNDFDLEENKTMTDVRNTLLELKEKLMEKYEKILKILTNELQIYEHYLFIHKKLKDLHKKLLTIIGNAYHENEH